MLFEKCVEIHELFTTMAFMEKIKNLFGIYVFYEIVCVKLCYKFRFYTTNGQ